jgi:hypothetical protein
MQENHYKYFKELYDEEGKRAAELHDNAKINITIVSLYGAFIGIGLTQTKSLPVVLSMLSGQAIPAYLFIATLSFIFIAIIISLYSTRISPYQVTNYPRDVLDVLSGGQSDSEFYEDRVIDVVAAYE